MVFFNDGWWCVYLWDVFCWWFDVVKIEAFQGVDDSGVVQRWSCPKNSDLNDDSICKQIREISGLFSPQNHLYIYIYVNYITTLKFLRVTCGEHTCYLFWEQKTLEVEYPVWPATTPNLRVLNKYIIYHHLRSRWWFKYVFFTPTWGNDPIWLISFRWVETTT